MGDHMICRCGHPEDDHYEYILNGRPQTRCRECDPHKNRAPGNYAMDSDSYVAAMYHAADHDFEPPVLA
jgi:hypothetical protein